MQEKKYLGEMTDANVSAIFHGAADFIRRELSCGKFQIYAYAIDGLIAAATADHPGSGSGHHGESVSKSYARQHL